MNKKNPGKTLSPILVAIDFSDHSSKALVFAAELCSALKRPLQILHVVHDPGGSPGYYSQKKAKKQLQHMEERAEEMFHDFIKKVAQDNPTIDSLKKPTLILVSGIPVTRILEIEKKLEPYMVIMGSQGHTGLAHLMLGSKAEQVVHLSKYPVTIIK
ncbi:MAG: universal stress protein [Gammaproteobacteria bacterium]|jgi:nucleotide-binding universal stress UspA family protein|nr:universal stress protein [Gammaproteobacteria bacterium]